MADISSYSLEALNVLVVEDNPNMQKLISEVLRALRIKNIRVAEDGGEALAELGARPADLVICDWEMEPMDGLVFTRTVRSDPESTDPYVPILMLTGHTQSERVEEARDAGVTEFLAKPISVQSLYERMCWIIEKPRQFIKGGDYVGPCRRRVRPTEINNKGRRHGDPSDNVADDE